MFSLIFYQLKHRKDQSVIFCVVEIHILSFNIDLVQTKHKTFSIKHDNVLISQMLLFFYIHFDESKSRVLRFPSTKGQCRSHHNPKTHWIHLSRLSLNIQHVVEVGDVTNCES